MRNGGGGFCMSFILCVLIYGVGAAKGSPRFTRYFSDNGLFTAKISNL